MTEAVTRSQVVARMSETLQDMPLADINAGVQVLLQHVRQALVKKRPIAIRGLGSFGFVVHPERNRYNLKTGTMEKIAARELLRFKPSRSLTTPLSPSPPKGGRGK